MSIEPKRQQGRNELCGCGSGLKFKRCHGDPGKRAVCEHYLGEVMLRLIMKEKHKRKLITDDEYQAFLDKQKLETVQEPVVESDVDEIMNKAKLKRCAGALCNAPIPDTETLCHKCQRRNRNLLKG